jgi:PiT family inorganic phosphate transporter
MAGLANFLGYFLFGVTVAKTIGNDVVQLGQMSMPILLAALIGAVVWNLITWVLGLPTSSSHALIGGLVGAAMVAVGVGGVHWDGVLKIFAFIFLAPVLGFLGAAFLTVGIFWAFRRTHPRRTRGVFKGLQLVAAAFFSVTHGSNDSQKSMAIIAMAMVAAGVHATLTLDTWVVFSCYFAISLGTVFGGWRIVKTMGTSITKIRAMEGFASNTAAGAVIMTTTLLGIPVSTTHVISGSIMGVGAVENAAKVKWITARRIVWAWIVTIPAAAVISGLGYWGLRLAEGKF